MASDAKRYGTEVLSLAMFAAVCLAVGSAAPAPAEANLRDGASSYPVKAAPRRPGDGGTTVAAPLPLHLAKAGGVFGRRLAKRNGDKQDGDKQDGKPSGAEDLLKTLDPFYKQHVTVCGMPIVGSEKVSKYALREVAYLVRKMLANRPDILKKLGEFNRYVAVMAHCEMQSDLPETRGGSLWRDHRVRGLGINPTSCGEENVLGYEGDPYEGENIFIHEFGHTIHQVLGKMKGPFNERMKALYHKTKKTGRFRAYGMGSFGEFWAEGVQSWFNCNKDGGLEALGPDGEHLCHINTREQVKKYMPEFAELLDDTFRHNKWVYVPVKKRLDQPHLRGYDPAKAPTFRWPPDVAEAWERAKKKQQQKNKK